MRLEVLILMLIIRTRWSVVTIIVVVILHRFSDYKITLVTLRHHITKGFIVLTAVNVEGNGGRKSH